MSKHNYIHKSFNKLMNRAIHQYNMIYDGDKIAVGFSGGKDSLSLMWTLSELRKKVLTKFSLTAIYIDLGFDDNLPKKIMRYCKQENYNFAVEYSNFGLLDHSSENRKNPCFLCSRLRRKRLFETTVRLGCNKLLLGHNKDDIIETMFLNIFYSGKISTMVPYQPLFGGEIKIIRPLIFIDEKMVTQFAFEKKIPNFINPCPSSFRSKRRDIKNLLDKVYKTNNKIKGNIFRSLSNVKLDYLLK